MAGFRHKAFAFLAIVCAIVYARSGVPAHAQPAPACVAPTYRQFDFWLGDWTVKGRTSGRFAGTNLVTRELSGCVIMEHWKGVDGSRGSSFNLYDATTHTWHQSWVDNGGGLLLLDGRLQSGSMVLEGTTVASNGSRVRNRIVWTPLAGGKVRQHWTSSKNDGRTWSNLFDGIYSRTK